MTFKKDDDFNKFENDLKALWHTHSDLFEDYDFSDESNLIKDYTLHILLSALDTYFE